MIVSQGIFTQLSMQAAPWKPTENRPIPIILVRPALKTRSGLDHAVGRFPRVDPQAIHGCPPVRVFLRGCGRLYTDTSAA